MAVRRPLVIIDGKKQELPAGDSTSGSGSASLSGITTITLPYGEGVSQWTETVNAVGVTPSDNIGIFIAPTTNLDENEVETIDAQFFQATAGLNTITIFSQFTQKTSGRIKLIWKVL